MLFNNSNEVIKAIVRGASAIKIGEFNYTLGNATILVLPGVLFKIIVNNNLTDYGNSPEGQILTEKLLANGTTSSSNNKASIKREDNKITVSYGESIVSIKIEKNAYWGTQEVHVKVLQGDKTVAEKLVKLAYKQYPELASYTRVI